MHTTRDALIILPAIASPLGIWLPQPHRGRAVKMVAVLIVGAWVAASLYRVHPARQVGLLMPPQPRPDRPARHRRSPRRRPGDLWTLNRPGSSR